MVLGEIDRRNDAAAVLKRVRGLFKAPTPEKIDLDLNDLISEVLRLLHVETLSERSITVSMKALHSL